MKILLINPSIWIYGGAERVIVKLANYLTDKHHEVTIITTQLCDEVRKDLKETRLLICEDNDELAYFVKEIGSDFDVINIHNEPGYLLTFPRKFKVVWLCNEPPHLDKPEPNELEKQAVKHFKVIVADEFNKKRLDKLYDVDSKIIPYGIDYDFFSKDLGVDKFEDFTVIQAGFIADTKNQLRTIEIFKKLREKIPNAKLKLVGKRVSEYFEKVKDKIIEYGLMGEIEYIEFCDREKLRALYQRSHAALFPIKSQGGWLSVFEAMSARLPVYVSEEATCSSILKEHGVGSVCATDDDFVDKITSEHNCGAEWVKENLTWDKFCQEFEKELK